MRVYVFSILAEEEEMFLREIALSEEHTLLDFHNMLTKNLKIDNEQLASFYLTNKQWEKEKEYTLMDMELDDYTNDKILENIPVDIMENAVLSDIITEPKQRMLYEYNFVNPTLFFITLMEEREEKKNETLPKVIRAEGTIEIDSENLFDDSFDAEMISRGRSREPYDDLSDDYDEDDLRSLGFEDKDGLYDDEFYGSDSYADDDF